MRLASGIARFRDCNYCQVPFFLLSLSPSSLPHCWFSRCLLFCLCLSVPPAFRLTSLWVQAHIIAPGSHPHIKLLSSAPVRKLPSFLWSARLGPRSQRYGQRAGVWWLAAPAPPPHPGPQSHMAEVEEEQLPSWELGVVPKNAGALGRKKNKWKWQK